MTPNQINHLRSKVSNSGGQVNLIGVAQRNKRDFAPSLICISLGLIAISWPLQVYLRNPYIALLPYVLVFAAHIIALNRAREFKKKYVKPKVYITDLLIFIYLLHVFFTTTYHLLTDNIDIPSAFAVFANHILPILFYIYFSTTATSKDVKYALWAIFITSVACSTFLVYETINKVAFEEITQFAVLAHEYSAHRMGILPSDMNQTRVGPQYRAVGLQDTQQSSTLWIILGFLSITALLGPTRHRVRVLFGSFTLVCLLLAQSFTAIIAFIILLLLNLSALRVIMRLRIRVLELKFLLHIFLVSLSLLLIYIPFAMMSSASVLSWILELLDFQIRLALGLHGYGGEEGPTYFGMLTDYLMQFFTGSGQSLYAYLFGDGYVPWIGRLQGGDFGLVETLHSFGIVVSVVVLTPLLLFLVRYLYSNNGYMHSFCFNNRLLSWCFSVLLCVLFFEIHYSVWYSKSIFPIICIAMGLLAHRNLTRATYR